MVRSFVVVFVALLTVCCLNARAQYSVTSALDTASSVLSTGKWVKARVSETGLYRLSSKTLSSWGFNDISKVAVFCNGGSALPLLNSSSRVSDLAKLPVYRTASELTFYVQGRQNWAYNTSSKRFSCSLNENDEYTYVFITDGSSPSQDLSSASLPETKPSYDITYNSSLFYHELHSVNLHKSGCDWYGESLSKQSPSLSVDFGSLKHLSSAKVYLSLKLCGVTKDRIEYSVLYNDSIVASSSVRAYQSSSEVGVNSLVSASFTHVANQTDNRVSLKCSMSQGIDMAYLDYITLEVPSLLVMPKSGILALNIAEGHRQDSRQVSRVKVSSAGSETQVWCIDNPLSPTRVNAVVDNGSISFPQNNTSAHRYVAFDFSKVSSLPEPVFVSNVDNQNLHATTADVDYLIVYHPTFRSQAEQLADFHRQYSSLSVVTADVNEIYNEFGGGQRSATAIRDYVRYVYKKSSAQLKYLLLFGAGSYDNLTYGSNAPNNLIPTYQSAQSLNTTQSYATDDFFGWLEDNEVSYDTRATVDIGIGRFPVSDVDDAQFLVDRVKSYSLNPPKSAWINKVVQFACEGDDNEHARFAEDNASFIEDNYESIDVTRIYSEVFPSTQTTTDRTYPQSVSLLFNSINNKGAVLINYVGHGGPNGAGTYIYRNKINQFSNNELLPFMIGATCDFAPFDLYTDYISKDLITYPYGGCIAVLSTTRLVYGNNSHTLNMGALKAMFSKNEDGKPNRLGDIVRLAKLRASSLVNSLKYVLLGDPAVVLANNADYTVTTDSVCGEPYESATTPIRAFTTNYVSGSVRDASGNVVESFNGSVEVSLYDKRRTRSTMGIVSPVFSFSEWGNRLLNSTYKVTNGRFSIPMQLSKDLDASEGYGRLSYVAWSDSDNRRAMGGSNMVLVGGFANELQNDTIGPDLNLYVDYPSWKSGGLTSSEPLVCAQMSDVSGINSSGVGIGHSITLTVDDNPNSTVVLDSYYSVKSVNPETGQLQYQLSNLSPGSHTVSLKVWDNLGNSTSKSVSLLVSANPQIQFDNIQFFPSAFSSKGEPVSLQFLHNNAGAGNTAQIFVYNLSGQLKCSASTSLQPGTSDSGLINLNQLMPSVSALANGFYIVNVKVSGTNGRRGEFSRKLAF